MTTAHLFGKAAGGACCGVERGIGEGGWEADFAREGGASEEARALGTMRRGRHAGRRDVLGAAMGEARWTRRDVERAVCGANAGSCRSGLHC